MISNLAFFISEAFTSLKRNILMTTVALGTIIVSLSIFGFFLLFVLNVGSLVSALGSKGDVVAYAAVPLNEVQAEEVKAQILRLEGVKGAEWVPREKAWKNFQEEFSGRLQLEDVVGENPLPDAFLIKVKTPDLVPLMAKKVSAVSAIEEVSYNPQLVAKLKMLMDAFRLGGLLVVFLLSIATLLIVVNTIRLTVLAREVEITIMRLVGATSSFIRWPFIIEGIILGMGGAVCAILILKFSYESMIVRIQNALPYLPLVQRGFWTSTVYLMVMVMGVFLGMLGGTFPSIASLRKRSEGGKKCCGF